MIIWRAILVTAALAMPASAQNHDLTQDDYEIVVSGKLHTLKLDFSLRSGTVRYCYALDRHENKAATELMCSFLRSCVARGLDTRDAAEACVNATLDRIKDRAKADSENTDH